mgnify:CR=1 FL=1
MPSTNEKGKFIASTDQIETTDVVFSAHHHVVM